MKMEATKEINEQPHSVELSINAKGQWSGKLKVYGKTINEAMGEAIVKAEIIEDLIKVKNIEEKK